MPRPDLSPCLTDHELKNLLDDAQSISDASIEHVDSCTVCQQRLETLSDSALLEAYREPVQIGRAQRLSLENPLEPGDLGSIDGISIKSKIAEGGMGIVYRGFDSKLNRPIAVKILTRHDSPEGNARFTRETQAAAKLSHANLVPIYSAGRSKDNRPYLVMPLIDGESFKQNIQDSNVTCEQAVDIVRQIALGLAEAHRNGIFHRDVTSSNILIDRRDQAAKLTDFGLVRTDSESGLTHSNIMCGTPEYMSPEQIDHPTELDARADIYSLGVVFYEALTGSPPFRGRPLDILEQHRSSEPVAPSRLNSLVSRDMETVCLKALQKNADDRYQTADEFADDLQRLLRNEPVTARRTTFPERAWRWSKRNPVIAMLSSLLVGLLITSSVVTTILWRTSVAREEEVTSKNAALEESLAKLRENQLELAEAMRGSAVQRLGDKQQIMELPTGIRNQMLIEIAQTWRLLLVRGDNSVEQLRSMADELILVTKSAAALKMRTRLLELTDLSKDIVDQIDANFHPPLSELVRTAIIYKQYGEARQDNQAKEGLAALEKAESIANSLVALNENEGIYGTQSAAVLLLDIKLAKISKLSTDQNDKALERLHELQQEDNRLRQVDSDNYFVVTDWLDLEQRLLAERAFRSVGKDALSLRQQQTTKLDLLIEKTSGTTDMLFYQRAKALVLIDIYKQMNQLEIDGADDSIIQANEIMNWLVKMRPINSVYRVNLFEIRLLLADLEWHRSNHRDALKLYRTALNDQQVVLENNPLDPVMHHRAAETYEQVGTKYLEVEDFGSAGDAFRKGSEAAYTSGTNMYNYISRQSDLELAVKMLQQAEHAYERSGRKDDVEAVRSQLAKISPKSQ